MLGRSLICAGMLAAAFTMTWNAARAFDESKYPNLKGQWVRARVPGVVGQPSYDPNHNQGAPQNAPHVLTVSSSRRSLSRVVTPNLRGSK